MSGDEPDEPTSYEVGYGKPPVASRFQPGRSGNPAGRPKGARSPHKQLLQAIDQPTRGMILDEMYRLIKVREGGREVTMPVILVIIRSLQKAAAEGSAHAIRTALNLQLELERDMAADNNRLVELARAVKSRWGPELERLRSEGLPDPELLPHPDDIHIDEERWRVEIRGPSTPEQKALLDKLIQKRDSYQKALLGLRAEAEQKPSDWTLPQLAVMAQERYDIINTSLPPRYRRPLEGRMTATEVERAAAKARRGLARKTRRGSG